MLKKTQNSSRVPPAKLARWQLAGLVVFFVAITALAFTVSAEQWESLLHELLHERGWTAGLSLTGLYIVAVILMVPLSPFAITAGVFFGFWKGSLLALVAINIGSLISFIFARLWLGHGSMHNVLCDNPSGEASSVENPAGARSWGNSSSSDSSSSNKSRGLQLFRIRALSTSSIRLLTSDSIKIISLLRMNPLVPFSLHNYIYGAARIRLTPYLVGTFLGSAPFTLVLVYFGVTGRVIYRTGGSLGPWQYTMIGLGVVLLLVLLALTKYAKSASQPSE